MNSSQLELQRKDIYKNANLVTTRSRQTATQALVDQNILNPASDHVMQVISQPTRAHQMRRDRAQRRNNAESDTLHLTQTSCTYNLRKGP